jgi:hypothetical protein
LSEKNVQTGRDQIIPGEVYGAALVITDFLEHLHPANHGFTDLFSGNLWLQHGIVTIRKR